MIDLEQSHPLTPGTYRIQELSDRLRIARTTVERYIERLSIPTTDILFRNKKVKALILDSEHISKILSLSNKESSDSIEHQSIDSIKKTEKQSSRLIQLEHEKTLLAKDLQMANQHIENLKAVLSERERVITAKDNEVSTLKTALMIVERNNQETPIELIPAKQSSLIGKIRQWLKNS